MKGIICFGDSILAGTGVSSREKGCAKRMKDLLNIPVALRGRNRDTSRDGLSRFGRDVTDNDRYSHVLIQFGNNDCWIREGGQPDVPFEQFLENIEAMVEKIRQKGMVPVLLNLQPLDSVKFLNSFPEYSEKEKTLSISPFEWQKKYSDGLGQIASRLHVDLIDIRSPLQERLADAIGMDGLHPSDFGHELIADTILTHLKRYRDLNSANQRIFGRSS